MKLEPVALLYQHDETGRTTVVDPGQNTIQWEEDNPRWRFVHALYAIPEGYVVVPMEEKGWLVEWSGMVAGKVVGPIAWLCLRPKHNGFGALEFSTTQDSTKALRLCRKEDADAVLKLHLGGGSKPDWYTEPYSVTEHIWSDKAMIAAKEQS